MDRHDGGPDQADRVLDQRPDHFLTPFAAHQLGFVLLASHADSLTGEGRSVRERRQGYARLNAGWTGIP